MTREIRFLVKDLVTLGAGETVVGEYGLSRFVEYSIVVSKVSLVGKLLVA